ncbi:MAG: hypothetical protein LBI61_03580 [Puniceicoccales bacterium]|jgi:hypothetical protein|nr:hypothetical protein [Puniceicoccales bacterium]
MKIVSKKDMNVSAVFPLPGDVKAEKKNAEVEPQAKKAPKTAVKVVANVDVGFGNYLYIRGDGCGLSWDRGVEMESVDGSHWLWECECGCGKKCFEFKVLVNDERWSSGENFVAIATMNEIAPQF